MEYEVNWKMNVMDGRRDRSVYPELSRSIDPNTPKAPGQGRVRVGYPGYPLRNTRETSILFVTRG